MLHTVYIHIFNRPNDMQAILIKSDDNRNDHENIEIAISAVVFAVLNLRSNNWGKILSSCLQSPIIHGDFVGKP